MDRDLSSTRSSTRLQCRRGGGGDPAAEPSRIRPCPDPSRRRKNGPGFPVSQTTRPTLRLRHAYGFAVFNALSFQVILGGPMVLYAKSLEASATVLGIVAGMMPLLTISQIPAADYLDRIGYKRFVMAGWSARIVFAFLMALTPLAGRWVGHGAQLVLLLALLFGFNLCRGIASSAWLPWITGLVPLEARGRYLAGDQAASNGASLMCFLVVATLLGAGNLLPSPAEPWQFVLAFTFSGLMGVASLWFLQRMPDTPVPPHERTGTGRVPWAAIAAHPPFRRLLELNAVWSLAYGGLTTFVVAFLKGEADLRDGSILLLMAVQFIGGLGAYGFGGRRLDLHGSKPALGFIMLAGCLVASGWFLMSAGVWKPRIAVALAFIVPLGLLNALHSAANNRLAMAIVPRMGRNHFFALFMVVWQVTLGLSPVFWGLVIDGVGGFHGRWLGLDWNRYSLFFGLVGLSFLAAFRASLRLEEPQAAPVETLLRDLFLQEPRRLFTRALGRNA